jgi:hypothetical protein
VVNDVDLALTRVVLINPVLDFANVFIRAAMEEMGEVFNPSAFAEAEVHGFFTPVPHFEMSGPGATDQPVPSSSSRARALVQEMISGFVYWAREGRPVEITDGLEQHPRDPLTGPALSPACDC